MNLLEALDALERATAFKPVPSGDGFKAKCPAHDDANPSLSVAQGENGTVLIHCFRGCTYAEIMSHLTIGNGQRKNGSKWKIDATYPYTDELGELLFEVVRFTPKKFRQRRPDPGKPGHWIWNLKGITRVLYRLPKVIEAVKRGEILWLVEGEKDANRLVEAGLCATTSVGGAKAKWLDTYTATLEGAPVAVLPDNDAPGIEMAQAICNALVGGCEDVRLIELPDLKEKEDIFDFLDEQKHGKTIEDLKALYEAAPVWTSERTDADEHESDAISSDRDIENRLTELGAARLLKEKYGEDLKHHSGLGWLVWDGQRWKRSEKDAKRYVHKLGDIIRKMVAGTEDPALAKKIYTHVKAIEKAQGARAILEQAKSLEGIDADAIEFDNRPWLLNCLNGVVDLRTGELLEHGRDLYITKLAPINYNPKATAPRYMQTLKEVFLGDEELVEYWQCVMGSALTGDTTQQCFFILHGTGSNGKTTLLVAFKEMLGPDFAREVNPEALLKNRGGYSSEIASLRGLRFVTCMETGQGRQLNEPLIKALTGGDAISARHLYHEPFEFTPELKLFFGTNHRPAIQDDSPGIWRRVRLIPFEAKFEGKNCDEGLAEKLRAEAEGILAWAVRGAMRAADGKPPLPDAVKAATMSYQAEEDTLSQFLADECDRSWEHAWLSKNNLYRAWDNFMGGRGGTQIAFGKRVKDRGVEDKDGSGRVRGWKGISLHNKGLLEKGGS